MDVADILKAHVLPTWRWSHFPAGERRDVRTGARLKRMGLRRGFPDMILISPAGLFHGLELKRIGQTLTDDQADFQLWCIRHGIPHSVAFTLDQALAALDHWSCLRIKITRPVTLLTCQSPSMPLYMIIRVLPVSTRQLSSPKRRTGDDSIS
jgi:hypothetical protein